MTMSEQARAWAKAEAKKRYGKFEGLDDYGLEAAGGFAAGVLHVLSLLESERVAEAVADGIAKANDLAWDRMPGDPNDVYARDARAALAAVVAAITGGGSES